MQGHTFLAYPIGEGVPLVHGAHRPDGRRVTSMLFAHGGGMSAFGRALALLDRSSDCRARSPGMSEASSLVSPMNATPALFGSLRAVVRVAALGRQVGVGCRHGCAVQDWRGCRVARGARGAVIQGFPRTSAGCVPLDCPGAEWRLATACGKGGFYCGGGRFGVGQGELV